jgi:hypothetical protein
MYDYKFQNVNLLKKFAAFKIKWSDLPDPVSDPGQDPE